MVVFRLKLAIHWVSAQEDEMVSNGNAYEEKRPSDRCQRDEESEMETCPGSHLFKNSKALGLDSEEIDHVSNGSP